MNVFFTYVRNDDKSFKILIDGGSCINILTKSITLKMNLKVEPLLES